MIFLQGISKSGVMIRGHICGHNPNLDQFRQKVPEEKQIKIRTSSGNNNKQVIGSNFGSYWIFLLAKKRKSQSKKPSMFVFI